MAKIIFLCDHSYFGADIRTKALGGIETSTILLAEALSNIGHEVEIYNDRDKIEEYEGITYRLLSTSRSV